MPFQTAEFPDARAGRRRENHKARSHGRRSWWAAASSVTTCSGLARFDADHARLREQVLRLVTDDCQEPGAPTRMLRVSMPAELVEASERLAEVRRQKEAAFDAGNLDRAAALRDQEQQLLAGKLRRERQLTAGVDVQTLIAENERVHREVERLRERLRRHGIEPNGGSARTT